MKAPKTFNRWRLTGVVAAVFILVGVAAPGWAQTPDSATPTAQAQDQAKLQAVQNDKSGYAAAIASRWEADAQASGKWDSNYAIDMYRALMNLSSERLLAAFEAKSYAEMLNVLARGPRPAQLGDFSDDLVYTPIPPCRIVDTRNIGSPVVGGSTRNFDLDNTSGFAFQGGIASACGPPFGVATAAAMNITVVGPVAAGHLTAWSFCSAMPLASVINFTAGETIANTTVVPDCPGAGSDFSIFAAATTHVVIDIVGYFAAPVQTALSCGFGPLATSSVANGANINFSPSACPAGFRAVSLTCHATNFFAGTSWSSFGITTTGSEQCQGVNNSGATQIYNAAFWCCSVPGR